MVITGGGGGAALINSGQWLDADAAAFGRVAEAARAHEKVLVYVNDTLDSTMSNTEASMGWKTVSSANAESNAMRNHGVGDDAVTSHRQVAASAEFFQQLLKQKQSRIDSLLDEHQKMQNRAHHQFADVQIARGLLEEARKKSPEGDHSAEQKTLDSESAQLRDINHRLEAIEEELEGHSRELDREAASFADTVAARNRVMGSYTDPHDDRVVPLGAIFGAATVKRFGAAGLVPGSKVLSAMARYQECDLEGEARLVAVRDIAWFLTPSQQEAFAAACPAWSAEVAQLKDLDQAMAMNHDPNSAEGKFFGQLKASGVDFDVNDSAAVPSQIRTVRAAWDSLSAQEKAYMAVAYPGIVGNLRGVPPRSRYRANRVAVIGALEVEKRVSKALRRAHEPDGCSLKEVSAALDADPLLRRTGRAKQISDDYTRRLVEKPMRMGLGLVPVYMLTMRVPFVAQHILSSERRQGTYQGMLRERFVENPGGRQRQFLAFDPADDGRVIEVIGTLGRSTKNVGTFVPGTGSDLEEHRNYVDSGRYFMKDHGAKENAQVVFLNGDFPDHLGEAPKRHYARETGRELVAHQVEMRMLTDDARLTMAGHSYGGAIVGKADQYGAPADNVVHLSSAGEGHAENKKRPFRIGKLSLTDGPIPYLPFLNPVSSFIHVTETPYPETDVVGDSRKDTTRHSYTPKGDAIVASQGFDALWLGHGRDPEKISGVNVLPEAKYTDDHPDNTKAGRPLSMMTNTKPHSNPVLDPLLAVAAPGGVNSVRLKNVGVALGGGAVTTHTDSHAPHTTSADWVGKITFGD